jgi:hypothetical protein
VIVVVKMNSDQQELTSEQRQAILLFQIEQKLRFVIAKQVEEKFHGMYHNASHEIAQFIRNMA